MKTSKQPDLWEIYRRLTAERGLPVLEATNSYRNGKKHGLWEDPSENGRVLLSTYEDGVRHGPRVLRYPEGGVWYGVCENGLIQGDCVIHFATGEVKHRFYVDDRWQR